jgi:cytochrome c biogenesis protein ResB
MGKPVLVLLNLWNEGYGLLNMVIIYRCYWYIKIYLFIFVRGVKCYDTKDLYKWKEGLTYG